MLDASRAPPCGATMTAMYVTLGHRDGLPFLSDNVVLAGVCALRQSTADMGKVARYTLLYYFSTTMGAVVLGIIIVNIIKVLGSQLIGLEVLVT